MIGRAYIYRVFLSYLILNKPRSLMSKFVSLSYFDLAELLRKSLFSMHRNKPMILDICL